MTAFSLHFKVESQFKEVEAGITRAANDKKLTAQQAK
jgi:hypothetical protein